MRLVRTLFGCFSLWLFFSLVWGQSCQIWDGNPVGCQSFVGFGPGTPIFVPSASSLANLGGYFGTSPSLTDIEAYLTATASLLRFVPYAGACTQYAITATCATLLRPCVSTDNQTYVYPQEPCREICTSYVQECSVFVPVTRLNVYTLRMYVPPNNGPGLTCNETDPDTANQTYWSTPNATMKLANGSDIPSRCIGGNYGSLADFVCNPPLVPSGLRCAFPCPLPTFSESQYDSAKIMQNILAWVSWAASSVLITSLLLYPPARAFPKALILLVSISANIAAGALLLPTFAGYPETWCGGTDVNVLPVFGSELTPDGRYRFKVQFETVGLTFHSSLCSFQGAMLLFGYLASTFWWVFIAFNMALELLVGTFLNKRERLWKVLRLVLYNVISWGLAFLLMLIPTSAGAMGFSPGATFCFVTEEDNYAWILTFFFIPVGISLLLGLSFFMVAIVKILYLAIKLRKPQLLLQYFRLLIFIFIFVFIYTFIFVYYITVAANQDEIVQGYEEYFGCLLLGQSCGLSDSVSNYNLTMLRGFVICSLGWLLFFNFMGWDLMKHWWNIFLGLYNLVRKQQHSHLISVVVSGKTQSSTTIPSVTTQAPIQDEEESESSDSTSSNSVSAEEELAMDIKGEDLSGGTSCD